MLDIETPYDAERENFLRSFLRYKRPNEYDFIHRHPKVPFPEDGDPVAQFSMAPGRTSVMMATRMRFPSEKSALAFYITNSDVFTDMRGRRQCRT